MSSNIQKSTSLITHAFCFVQEVLWVESIGYHHYEGDKKEEVVHTLNFVMGLELIVFFKINMENYGVFWQCQYG